MEWKYTIGEMEENTCQELANAIVKLWIAVTFSQQDNILT